MSYQIHTNARTTPTTRKEIQTSTHSQRSLANRFGVSRLTIQKWQARKDVGDRSHRPHTLQTTLTPLQEDVVVALRTTLLLPLDDLLAVTREFIATAVSRSGLHRCLKRHGVSDLIALLPVEEGASPPIKRFKTYDPGFVHVDVKHLPRMPDQTKPSYLFAAIDRATRWVYLEIHPRRTAKIARAFLSRLLKKAPFIIQKILTDNGKEFTDRFCATGERQPTGRHPFDQVCRTQGIDHRLIKPRRPQTNGMIERFNGRIAEVLRQTRFPTVEALTETLMKYEQIYNQYIPQRALGHLAPVQALKNWRKAKPDLFHKREKNHTGLDN